MRWAMMAALFLLLIALRLNAALPLVLTCGDIVVGNKR